MLYPIVQVIDCDEEDVERFLIRTRVAYKVKDPAEAKTKRSKRRALQFRGIGFPLFSSLLDTLNLRAANQCYLSNLAGFRIIQSKRSIIESALPIFPNPA